MTRSDSAARAAGQCPGGRPRRRGNRALCSPRGSGYFPPVLRIIRHPGPRSDHRRGAVLAMGNFDGLHLGHAALIGHARSLAEAAGAPSAVLTFEPHPRSVFFPGGEAFRLTPLRVKEREIARLGVDLLFVQHFDAAFAQKSAESFVEEIMVAAIGVSHVVVGHDCTFGNRRRGTAAMLQEAGAMHGFGVSVVDPVRSADAAVYSSTHIRELLRQGRPREAAAQLGRAWEIDGRVAVGDRRGRLLGFPTANIGLGEYLRPTVGGHRPRLEAHLFDIDRDLYGRHLRVALYDFIRPERKFSGLDELKAQIAADAATARRLLADLQPPARNAM